MSFTRSWATRKGLLDQCHALQNFNHEAEQAESWMAKREAFLSSEDVGSSLDAVEALIKKHEDFDKSLQAQVWYESFLLTRCHKLYISLFFTP